MIDTANMGIMANFIQPTSNSMSTQMISKKDSDNDSSLNIEEMGLANDIFSSYDLDLIGSVSQSELTSAIEMTMSNFSGAMPSKEDFQSMLSSFGFDAPSSIAQNNTYSSQEDAISSILSNYDANNLSESDAQSIVASFKEAGIELSEELVSAMEKAGFDAKEVGTLAGVGGGQDGPPPGGGGGISSSEEEYDSLDTNEDGVVSLSELQASYGTTSNDETTSISSNQQNAKDNLSVLMDVLKSGSQSEDSVIDTKSFDGLLKAINNQNNNSQLNTYLQSSNTSALFGYA